MPLLHFVTLQLVCPERKFAQVAIVGRLFCIIEVGERTMGKTMWRHWGQWFLLLAVVTASVAQYPADCDRRKACIYNALRQTVTSGKGAQYVEVETGAAVDTIRSALTVEMWVRIEPQSGKRQFLAGVWGPHRNANDDVNDVWVLYVDEQNRLVFEVHPGLVPGPADYTTVWTEAQSLYDQWHHIAAVFDGATQEARLYVDGKRMAIGRNAQYPATQLNVPQQRFPLLIGNSNALSDDPNYRTFKGWMDEIRIWAVAQADSAILCNKDRSLNGNEPGLRLYYRCNEEPEVLELCDATGNNQVGRLRSGARCERSSRRRTVANWTDLPNPLIDTLFCETTKQYIFSVQDTSVCGGRARLRVVGQDRNYFTVRPTGWFPLQPGVPVLCTLTVNTNVIGSIQAELRIIPDNRCARYIRIPVQLERETQLAYDTNRLWFDTLYAYCREERWRDLGLQICNQTDRTSNPQTITIQQLTNQLPQVFEILSPKPPVVLAPGECVEVRVRFYSRDSTMTYFDTLRVYSTDACAPISVVVLEGSVQEVLELTNSRGRLDTLNFQATCPRMVSLPILYTWRNLLSEPVQVDTIIMPPFIVGKKFKFPVTLMPNTGYRPNYFRFRPLQPGWVFDSIIFRMHVGNCTIDRVVYVRGRGLDSDLRFEGLATDTLHFDTVVIGQQKQLFVDIRNASVDPLNLAFYLEQGEAFRLPQPAASVGAGKVVSVPIVFQPVAAQPYLDRFCYFEKRCYAVGCIYVDGIGIEQTFSFQPALLRIENVLGCSSDTGSVRIRNITENPVTLTQIQLNDPGGRFTPLAPLPSQKTLPPGGEWRVEIRYTPNDLLQDRADRAELSFQAAGALWSVQIIGTSVTPKLYVTPLTTYGIVEIGDEQRATVVVQNISAIPVQVDSITVAPGFAITSVTPTLPVVLAPRDSILVEIAFRPTQQQPYNGEVRAYSSSPCVIPPAIGQLQGQGTFVELEAPLSVIHYSYVRPCECEERILPLVNGSLVNDAIVDSIWIDAAGIASNAAPQYFAWRSKFSPNGQVPYAIPPQQNDTLWVTYCPRARSIDTLLEHSARLHIRAHAPGWSVQYDVYLSGKQVMMFAADRTDIAFVDTPVDTVLIPEEVEIEIPDYELNPWQEPLQIDSIRFIPDERVFFANLPTPWVLQPGEKVRIQFRFQPRAARTYRARVQLYFSKPCTFVDTSIALEGTGFAQPFGLQMTFEDRDNTLDSSAFLVCDTIALPLYFSRNVPGTVVDIALRLRYDTTWLELVGIRSPYLADTSAAFPPSASWQSIATGAQVLLKNFAFVDSLQPFAELRFIARQWQRFVQTIVVDSIAFDTEDVLYYKIVAGVDSHRVRIRKPEFAVLNAIDFGTLRILECATDTLQIVNTGDTVVRITDVLQLPAEVEIVAFQPPQSQWLQPGDTSTIVLRYCPRQNLAVADTVVILSDQPCFWQDLTTIQGAGYAPQVSHHFGLTAEKEQMLQVQTQIGDTVTIAVYSQDSLAARYNNTIYWLNGLRFQIAVFYNPFMFRFLSAQPLRSGQMDVANQPGQTTLDFAGVDTLLPAALAQVRYQVLVPDTTIAPIILVARFQNTDSLLFLQPTFVGDSGLVQVDGKCNIRFLRFPQGGDGEGIIQIAPHPVSTQLRCVVAHTEQLPLRLEIWNLRGAKLRTVVEDQSARSIGIYQFDIDVRDLAEGIYLLRYQTPNQSSVRVFTVQR